MKLNSAAIERKTENIRVYSFDTVDSTNKIAKNLAANGCDEGVVVCARKQTDGKGRLGRTFLSKRGGVYFSLVLRPKNNMKDTVFITVAAAVAAARAVETVSGKKCYIKWVNDLYINGKKVCGILTEGGFDQSGAPQYAVLGVGINLFAPKGDFPPNLPLADSVFGKKDKILFKKRAMQRVISEFLNEFFKFYKNIDKKEFIGEYQARSFLTGKEITYIKNGETLSGRVVCIDDDARLVVKACEKTETLSHGEIQIVGMEQPAV